MGAFLKIQGGELRPGEAALVEIVFVVIEPLRSFFKRGFVWEINEGSLKIGIGEILEIVEEKQVPTLVSKLSDPK